MLGESLWQFLYSLFAKFEFCCSSSFSTVHKLFEYSSRQCLFLARSVLIDHVVHCQMLFGNQ